MQFEPPIVGIRTAQPSTNIEVRFTSSLLDTTIPRIITSAIRSPRVTATSTTNSVINSTPRMSSVIIPSPGQLSHPTSVLQTNPLVSHSQEEAISNIVYNFNRRRFASYNIGNIQTQNTNPFLADLAKNHDLITTLSRLLERLCGRRLESRDVTETSIKLTT